MRNIILPFVIVVAIISCVLAVNANGTTSSLRSDLGQERYKRMLAEEQLQKAKIEINKLAVELAGFRNKVSDLQEILNLGQIDHEDLKVELSSITQERESLRLERVSFIKKIDQLQSKVSLQVSGEQASSP